VLSWEIRTPDAYAVSADSPHARAVMNDPVTSGAPPAAIAAAQARLSSARLVAAALVTRPRSAPAKNRHRAADLKRVRLLWSEAGAVCDLGFCA
jgi:hypothetical protein